MHSEEAVTIARAINNARTKLWFDTDAQTDRVARSIADALWPASRSTLTTDCTRRMFLVSAGVSEPTHRLACGPQSGCADAPFPPG